MHKTLSAPAPAYDGYRWQIERRSPSSDDARRTAATMTAAEQMFFLGAPLAHVIAYERLLKAKRVLGSERTAARLTRVAIRQFQHANPAPASAEA